MFKKFKALDIVIKYLLAVCIGLVVYAVYVAYMAFIAKSTLPFARYEELIVIGGLIVVMLLIAFLRSRYLKYKNNR